MFVLGGSNLGSAIPPFQNDPATEWCQRWIRWKGVLPTSRQQKIEEMMPLEDHAFLTEPFRTM